MKVTKIIINILAIVLPSLRISSLNRAWLVAMGILSIVLFHIAVIAFYTVYIQSIGSGMNIFSGLFNNFLLVHYCAADENFSSLLLLSSLLPVKPRLTKVEKEAFSLSQELKDITIGLLLGDLYARKQKLGVNVCLAFRQGIVHEDYLNHLYKKFQDFCPQGPKIQIPKPDIRTGIVHRSIYFSTYTLPCFNELYKLFYFEGKKVIPLNIAELLTPLGLCYWICDDGSFCKV